MDANYYEKTGGIVRSYYRYDGDVDEELSVVMGAFTNLRYAYVQYLSGESLTLHMWTGSFGCTGRVTVLP